MALVGMGHDAVRAIATVFECGNDLAHLVTVDFRDVPAECFQLGSKRCNIVGVRERRTLLEAIVINDKRQIIEAKLGGRHNRFPVRAFLHLAVAGHHIGVVIGARKLGGFGHADRNRQAVAKWPVFVSTPAPYCSWDGHSDAN